MNKKIKFYLFFIAITMVAMLIMTYLIPDVQTKYYNDYLVEYNDGWKAEIGGTLVSIAAPPCDIGYFDSLVIHNVIPEEYKENAVLTFFTSHQNVEIYKGDTKIYYFGVQEGETHTPGNAWHFVELSETGGDSMDITIILTSKYADCTGDVPEFKLGTYQSGMNYVIHKNMPSLLLCLVIFIIGMLITLFWIIFRREFLFGEEFLCMGFFAMSLAAWSAVETQVISIVFGNYYAVSQMAFIALMLMQFPFINFTNVMYNKRYEKIFNIVNIGIFIEYILVFGLDLFRIRDFRNMITFIQVCLAVVVLCALLVSIYVVVKKDKENLKMGILNLMCITGVIVAMCFDMWRYYNSQTDDAATFGRVMMLIYIVALTSVILKDAIKIMRAGKSAERIKKMAFTDVLTNVSNRVALTDFLDHVEEKDCKDIGIAMFDLNNLKVFNDEYGHNVGDYYIILCSEVLNDMFHDMGKVYRLGGDEFCAVLSKCTEEEFENIAKDINERLWELKGPYTKAGMGIGKGYAVYDPTKDADLYNTMNRADMLMYEDKKTVKMQIKERLIKEGFGEAVQGEKQKK